MTVHYELPTTADFTALAGPHEPAITIYAATSPVVNERERAEVAVKSAFDEAFEQLKSLAVSGPEVDSIRRARDEILGDLQLWGNLARSMAIFVAPGFSEVFVLPNQLDDAVHVGSHFTLGQLLRAPSQDQEAYAVAISANEWTLWHATPTDRAAQMPVDPSLPKNVDEAANREPGDVGNRRVGGHGDRGMSEEDRRPSTLDIYAKRVADAVRQVLLTRDAEERVPLFVFAAEPMLSQFIERAHNGRRIAPVQGGSDRLGPAEIDEAIRHELARLNISEAESALRNLADGSAGRVERDLAAIARLAADGAVDTLWFDFTTSVNGTLDRESGAVQFATGNGSGDNLHDGTHAGDLLPQLALLVMARGGKVVTVRGDDLDGSVWSGPAMAELRFALA
ncbi:MAG TPA: hypothetical protein VNP97_11765 [Microbacterium sp.]|nr:hypothetical protein [Microbacterium sp.]